MTGANRAAPVGSTVPTVSARKARLAARQSCRKFRSVSSLQRKAAVVSASQTAGRGSQAAVTSSVLPCRTTVTRVVYSIHQTCTSPSLAPSSGTGAA